MIFMLPIISQLIFFKNFMYYYYYYIFFIVLNIDKASCGSELLCIDVLSILDMYIEVIFIILLCLCGRNDNKSNNCCPYSFIL